MSVESHMGAVVVTVQESPATSVPGSSSKPTPPPMLIVVLVPIAIGAAVVRPPSKLGTRTIPAVPTVPPVCTVTTTS